MAATLWLFLIANILLVGDSFAANAAYDKQVDAKPSCGVNRSEIYYHISHAKLLPFRRNYSICDQSEPMYAHPPEAIVDENYTTFWQAKGGENEAGITIDLSGLQQKFYYVHSITISFGDYYRPGQIAFYKKSSESGNFEPWHYLVTEGEECQSVFRVPHKTIPFPWDEVICTRYKIPAALETNENVTVEFEGGRGTVVINGGELNTQLLDWMNTTMVKIKFSQLRLFPDRLASRWQHYVVREVQVEAYCHCNGHADGMSCPYNQTSGDRECVCQEGTCGVQCGYCCPAYNQHPYKIGGKGPFERDEKAACEKCNCHDHSDVCVYNATVANNTCSYGNNATNDECSMDIFGKYNGGGVCVDCKDNTEGINCQRCITRFYRKSVESHWKQDACQPCNCFVNGTMNTTWNGVEYLDCVRDDEEADELGDLAPGDCLCKNKTTGMRCNRCVDGYYNLTAENPQGCLACLCNTPGAVNASINCDDEGLCSCKNWVRGDKCSECQHGTFNLAHESQYGCTECMCSNITQNCTSTSMYRSKTKYDLKGWNLTRGFDEKEIMTVLNIQEEMNGRSVDLISANVTTGQLLYWTTDEDYFEGKSLVTSYGGNLEFTRKVSFVQNGTLQTALRVVMKGPRNITIETVLAPLNNTIQSPTLVSVKMAEFGWKYHNTSTTVDRRTFVLVLSKPERIWISASYFTLGNGTYQTSFGNLHISSVANASNAGNVAVDVEQCSCGEAYQGLSCERCARGYHRENVTGHPFFGQCIPCNCHGHTEDCDPDTGKCLDCQHNTTGFYCHKCRDGFYGDARNGTDHDCGICQCEPPKTTTDLCVMLSNGSAQCLNCSQGYEKNLECNKCELGYFGRPFLEGGNCSLCQCNNNSNVCNRENGSCLDYCENNSTGWHCERCENGTYGNATKQQCRACTCDTTGSYDVPCNFRSGHCHCKPNVQGFNCSECEENAYGFSDTGCQQCECNEFGSVSLQCNDSGICECKNHTHVEKCDACMDGYYGLPNASCQACACNSTGSNGTVCDHVTGQCPCKPGVDGRRCDRCKVQHKDFSDAGCEPCPACSMKLQGIVDDASDKLTTSKNEATQADKSLNYYPELEALEGKIPRVKALEEEHTNVIKRLEEYRKTLTNTSLNATILELEERDEELRSEAQILSRNVSSEMQRIATISNHSKSANDYARDVKEKTEKIVDELKKLSDENKTMNTSSSDAVHFMDQSINQASVEIRRAENLTNIVTQLSSRTEDADTKVQNQTNVTTRLSNKVEYFNNELNGTRMQIEKDKLLLNKTYEDIERVKRLIGETNRTIEHTNALLKQTVLYINESSMLTADGETNYKHIIDTRLPELNQQLTSLMNDLNTVNGSYVVVRELVANASKHAEELTAEADRLERNFSDARLHGDKAVSSIETYKQTIQKINNAVNLSMQANKDVRELLDRIHNLTVTSESVNVKALECRNASANLLAATKARNIDLNEKNNTISQVSEIFNTANQTCVMVETYASIFESKRTLIVNVAASDRPLIGNYIENATDHVSKTRNISEKIELNNVELKKRLTKANDTLAVVNVLVVNSTQVLDNTHFTVNETEKLLANITQSVNRTKEIKRLNDQTEQELLGKLAVLKAKLKAAKEKVAKFRLAMKVGNTSVQYQPTPRMISNPLLNMISLDFKTNRSNGLLLYMSPSVNNTHQYISVKLVSERVRFTYRIQSPAIVITNWEVKIQENVWYRVYATRYRDKGRLTVTKLDTGFTRTYEDPKRILSDLEMNFNVNSSVFLGGLPSYEKTNISNRYFDGDLDNLVLNEGNVALWEPLAVEGVRRFATRRVSRKTFAFCDTFHGNGFVKQRAHDFDTEKNSSLSFQFRTFFKNTLMVMVEGTNKEFVYSVSLNNGRVIFHYNNTRLASARSNYHDGRWYHVGVTRTLKNASLLVQPLYGGPGEEDNNYMNGSRRLPLYLPSAEYVYFGGTNETWDRYAGGMKFVSLSSLVRNGPIRRNLNDKNLTVESSGVAFSECLGEVERGLSYSSGYSAVKTENITSLTSLVVRFKTSEPSGLLAYSFKENLHFYLALFHGNVFLMYTNDSSRPRPLQTQTETLNDGAYHIVEVTMQGSRIEMSVDKGVKNRAEPGESASRDLPPDVPTPLPLENLYIAGIPSSVSIPLPVPVLGSFNGDIVHVKINGDTIFDGSSTDVFTSAVTVGVSAAGVPPAPIVHPTPQPTNTPAPPTCGAKYPEKIRSEKQDEVHFKGIDSFLALNANRSLINDMASSFVISIEFRALSPNGILFLAADNQTSQFVSLELVDGKLVYQFNTGSGLVRMKTTGTYSIAGSWYKVDLLRINHFGAMVVRQTKEYHKNKINGVPNEPLNVNHIFVGGITGDVDTSVLENPKALSFFGCIREVSIQTKSATQEFNLSGDSIPDRTRNVQPGQCYDYVQPQVSFDGSGYAKLGGTYDLSPGSEVSIRFRTRKRNGLLFLATDQNKAHWMSIEQVNGQILLNYTHENAATTVNWTALTFNPPRNASYYLCKNIYRTINMRRSPGRLNIMVDGHDADPVNITDDALNATVYIGGIPSGLQVNVGVTGRRFTGCIESVHINQHVVDFVHEAAEQEYMDYGCRAPIKAQQSYAGLNIFKVMLVN